MKRALMLAVVLAFAAGSADAKICFGAGHKIVKCPVPPAASSAKPPKHCVTGVPCGNSCIKKGLTCHIK